MRVSYEEMYQEFYRVLVKYGFSSERASLSAKMYVDASCDGVYTHGLNRFPKFIKSINQGSVDIHAVPVLKEKFGILERYDGNCGPGNLNAHFCMKRAIQLAKESAMSCVALSNTNHWMRPGNYGLMAAKENCIGILWTNTVPNMPAWGGKDAKLGNNPVVIAIPHGDTPVLLDIAMSMFSYGKLEDYARNNKTLPVDGGFNEEQQMTKNPAEILKTHQSLPIGYWKGSGLSLALDLVASTLAGGYTTRMIGELPAETKLSQIFMAVSLDSFPDQEQLRKQIDDSLQDLQNSVPIGEGQGVYFPGQNMRKTREENRKNGIPVDETVWKSVLEL